MLEEAKKRDHRKLGRSWKSSSSMKRSAGLPLWLPNGGVMIEELEKLAKEMEIRLAMTACVRRPHEGRPLPAFSGHLPYYAESMYPPMELEGVKYYVKPMNCPMHHKIFGAKAFLPRPARAPGRIRHVLPLREIGELFGLMRVRSMQMNDAHIYCSRGAVRAGVHGRGGTLSKYFDLFGIEKYVMRLSRTASAVLARSMWTTSASGSRRKTWCAAPWTTAASPM
jgi:threonyl-tRNA synthetase